MLLTKYRQLTPLVERHSGGTQPASGRALLNEDAETIAIASQSGFRCFTTASEFQKYVRAEVLADEAAA